MASKKRGKKRSKKGGAYRSPGVYLEEVPAGARPIGAVGTSVAAFVGIAPPNPVRAATAALVVAGSVALVVWAVRGRAM